MLALRHFENGIVAVGLRGHDLLGPGQRQGGLRPFAVQVLQLPHEGPGDDEADVPEEVRDLGVEVDADLERHE